MENKEDILNDDEFVLIENWSKQIYFGEEVLVGNVINHPRHESGKCVVTSPIVKVDPINKYLQSRTGTKYKLGKVDPDYEKEYPNAEERIFKCKNDL